MIKMVVNGMPKNQSRLLLDTKIFKQINENNLKAYITERKNKTMSNVEQFNKEHEDFKMLMKAWEISEGMLHRFFQPGNYEDPYTTITQALSLYPKYDLLWHIAIDIGNEQYTDDEFEIFVAELMSQEKEIRDICEKIWGKEWAM